MTTITIAEEMPIALSGGAGTDLFAVLCRRRGWTDEYLAAIDSTDHDELLGLAEMVEALEDARACRKKLVIVPDFDMDGISSGVLGFAGLSELGFDVEMHLPDYRRGHDVGVADVAEINARWPGTQVILTCDGGVNSHDGIRAARALGWTTLVTDHHEELLPGSAADVTVDPCRIDETYANKHICGAHVLHQLLDAYARKYQPGKRWEIRLLRLFAGLGTVSDVMPVLFENRQLIRDSVSVARLLRAAAPMTLPNPWGGMGPDPDAIDVQNSILLRLLGAGSHHPAFIRAFQGFALVLKAFAQHGKLRDVDDLDEGFYGFYLAPAMNSPRRIGGALNDCFAVFTAASADEQLAAMHRVIEGNELRKKLVEEHLVQLATEDQPLAPWVFFSDARPGMLGLLANRLMERAGHPVVVLGRPLSPDEQLSGSGRAPAWFRIIDALDPYDGLMAIGHQQACGVRVRRTDRLDDLVAVLREGSLLAQLDGSAASAPCDLVLGPDEDCDAGLDDLTPIADLVRRLEMLKPFGHGFPEPVVELALDPTDLRVDRIGSEGQHLRLVTRDGLACLWWNAADAEHDRLQERIRRASRSTAGTIRFVVKLQVNAFRGESRLQAVIAEQRA